MHTMYKRMQLHEFSRPYCLIQDQQDVAKSHDCRCYYAWNMQHKNMHESVKLQSVYTYNCNQRNLKIFTIKTEMSLVHQHIKYKQRSLQQTSLAINNSKHTALHQWWHHVSNWASSQPPHSLAQCEDKISHFLTAMHILHCWHIQQSSQQN